MKKKKLITMLTALVLVGVVGVGATLAYMSKTTDRLTNNFTVGNVDITLSEEEFGTETGERILAPATNNYYNLYPSQIVTKDPKINITAQSSSKCYLFMKVSNLDELIGSNSINPRFIIYHKNEGSEGYSTGINDRWEKATGGDGFNGVYYYADDNGNPVVCEYGDNISPIFDQIKYSEQQEKIDGSLSAVFIQAGAYQAEGINFNEYFTPTKLNEIFPAIQ